MSETGLRPEMFATAYAVGQHHELIQQARLKSGKSCMQKMGAHGPLREADSPRSSPASPAVTGKDLQ